jgi:glucose-6-phosphate 1-dehydrogenase
VLRTGKGLGVDRHEIAVHFHGAPHSAIGVHPRSTPNVLRIQLDSGELVLSINVNAHRDLAKMDWVHMESPCLSEGLPAYARLLLDVVHEDLTWSVRDDETEESWRIVEPILRVWSQGGVPLQEYPAGSSDPV